MEVERNREATAWVEHTQIVLRALGSYTGEILSAETGQRGYLLTGQSAYLRPYEDAAADNNRRFEQLRRLIIDREASRDALRLSEIFKAKLEELARTVQLAKSGNLAGAMAIVREGSGHRYMVEFQRLSQEIADREGTLLARRQVIAADETTNIQIVMIVGGFLSILLIFGAGARTVAIIDSRARYFMQGIAAIADGRQDFHADIKSRYGNDKIVIAFNEMADRLLAAKQARERVEADLALSNRNLQAEVMERTAAQGSLLQSVTELRRSNEELDNFAYGASTWLQGDL